MILSRLTHILLQGERYAIPTCVLVSLLPLVNCFSWIMMTFVTIRRGATASLPVLSAVLLPQVGLAFAMFHNPIMALQISVSGLLLWLAASMWHRFRSWTLILEVTLLAASAIIVVVHLFVPDLAAQWQELYREYWQRWSEMEDIAGWWQEYGTHMLASLEHHHHVMTIITHIATGMTLAVMILVNFVQLMIAQAWEQRFFKSNQWRVQFRQIRLSRVVSMMWMVLAILAFCGSAVAQDLLPVCCLVFALAGLSLFHANLMRHKTSMGWVYRTRIIAVYTLLVLLLAYAFFGLVILALFDSVLDLRRRWPQVQLKTN